MTELRCPRRTGRRRGAGVGSGPARGIELYYCCAGRADSCSVVPIGSASVSVVTPLSVTHTLALTAPPEPNANCRTPHPLLPPPPCVWQSIKTPLSRTKSASSSLSLLFSLVLLSLLYELIHWKLFFFVREENTVDSKLHKDRLRHFLEQCSFFPVTWASSSYWRKARQFNLVEAGCRLGSLGALGGRTVGAAACFITPDLYLSCTWSWIPT